MSSRSWFRYSLNFSDHPIVSRVEEEFGAAGFGQLIKLLEQMITQIKGADGPVVAELSTSKWSSKLGFKPKGFRRFSIICKMLSICAG